MDETSAPLPFVTSSLYPGVVSFSPDVIPESVRKLEINVSLELGITSIEPFMTGLPLLPIATLSLTPHGSSRQSVGSHGNIT
jgi:hypothetical protein